MVRGFTVRKRFCSVFVGVKRVHVLREIQTASLHAAGVAIISTLSFWRFRFTSHPITLRRALSWGLNPSVCILYSEQEMLYRELAASAAGAVYICKWVVIDSTIKSSRCAAAEWGEKRWWWKMLVVFPDFNLYTWAVFTCLIERKIAFLLGVCIWKEKPFLDSIRFLEFRMFICCKLTIALIINYLTFITWFYWWLKLNELSHECNLFTFRI